MDAIKEFIPLDNQVFAGGIGLGVLAGGAQALRLSYQIGIRMLRRQLLTSLEVTSKDKSFPWVLHWLSVQQGARTQHLSVETLSRIAPGNAALPGQGPIGFRLVHGPGQHLLRYKNHFILVQRSREQQMVDLNTGKPWEKVVFTSFGRNVSVFEDILSDAYNLTAQQEEGKTIIFTNWGSEWRQFGQPRVKRSIDSVVLDEHVADNLVNDVTTWIDSAAWYRDRGIPYRRGYLLHGPPGSGKSSFIYALAGKLDYNICILNLNERGLTDDRLALALSSVPPHSIVLLEDIDAAFPINRSSEDVGRNNSTQQQSDVTFSGLLNVLDGVAASEDRIVFMTTNHIDRLDPALIRPGRVDYCQHIGDATNYQIKKLFQKFYSATSSDGDSEKFTHALRAVVPKISMAALQGYLLQYKNSQQDAIDHVHSVVKHSSSAMHRSDSKSASTLQVSIQNRGPIKPRAVKPLTAEQVDKMFFNPQNDWDKNL